LPCFLELAEEVFEFGAAEIEVVGHGYWISNVATEVIVEDGEFFCIL